MQDLNLGSNSNGHDIPPIQKHCKILQGLSYHRYMVDENGDPFYPSNYNMPSSNIYPRPMVLHNGMYLLS